MDFERIFARIKFFTYTAIGIAGVGALLLLIGLIAQSVVLDILGLLMIIGGMALFFYVYPEQAKNLKIKKARDYILANKVVSESELATALSVRESEARGLIDVCFRKGCVPGYIRKGQKIYHHAEYAKEKQMSGKTVIAIDCPNCGANFKGVGGEPNECPYCGSYVNS